MQFQSPWDIYSYIISFVSNKPKRFGAFGLDRTKYLASLVGNPQDDYPVIHIAGTSGKWSTAFMASQILKAHGYKTWLHVSPHVLDRRERVQIDNTFADDTVLIQAAQKLAIAIEKCSSSEYGTPSYYEAMIVLAYLSFSLAKVDVAIIEVGCGGLYDGSNIVSRKDKISVITRQWYDHQDIVGETLEEIAENDVGIILPWSCVVALDQEEKVCNQIIQQGVEKQWAHLHTVYHGLQYANIRIDQSQTVFDYTDLHGTTISDIALALLWSFQPENAALALTATQLFVSQQGGDFDRDKTKKALLIPWFAGRYDVRIVGWKTIILDGAHNPQKMHALVETLQTTYPQKNIVWYVAFKQGKHREEMLDIMTRFSQKFILWSFNDTQDIPLYSVDTTFVSDYLVSHGATVQSYISPEDFFQSLDHNISQDDIVVITWSLYRLSRVYKII